MRVDVAIVGGGPAGLAVAIGAARRGLSVVVLERQRGPLDKACGEGILPSGVHALERLGVRARLSRQDATPLSSIRFVDRHGASIEGTLPDGGGLAVRRVALIEAMRAVARDEGAKLVDGSRVRAHARTARAMRVDADPLNVETAFLVAADGLASPLRAREGLDGAIHPRRRFGARRHFEIAHDARSVEVHLEDGLEAYVTPSGTNRVGVAFLGERARGFASFDAMMARFPKLAERFAHARPVSRVLGAGPLARSVGRRTRDRFALVGDAAGYVDAATGEGLSLAFASAEALVALLPDALRDGATEAALAPYERAVAARFAKYAAVTHGMLALSRAPRLRTAVLSALQRAPRLLDALVAWSVG